RRPGSKRSRTGCRTCRARRIKCDETPNKCLNCTSTGRLCDGYDFHRQLPYQLPQRLIVAAPIVTTVPWASTSDERRCFAFVHARTIPDTLSYFDSVVWQRFLLQMVPREPAVWHAVVALGALHQQIETGGLIGRTPTVWHWLAIAQSARSFACLQRRNPHDPVMRNVTLLCCLLFTVMDLIRQEYKSSLHHLRAGLRILRETEQPSPQESPTSADWIATFRHLDTQIGVDDPSLWCWSGDQSDPVVVHPEIDPWWRQQQQQESPASSLHHLTGSSSNPLSSARQTLEPLFNRLNKFARRCWRMSPAEIQAAQTALSAEQLAIATQLRHATRFMQAFRREEALSPKHRRGAELLELWVASVSLVVRTCPHHHDAALLRRFTPQYGALLRRIQQFIADFPERPTVTVDLGVIRMLFIVGDGCQDFRLRWEAIQALRNWPHQEGPFYSVGMAALL
ncbi:Zn(II)2Cys6 transcription factor, partial [Aspergillus homomorphus CBS 101889]